MMLWPDGCSLTQPMSFPAEHGGSGAIRGGAPGWDSKVNPLSPVLEPWHCRDPGWGPSSSAASSIAGAAEASGSKSDLALIRFLKVLLSSSHFLWIMHCLSTIPGSYRNCARLFRSRAIVRAEVPEMRAAWTHPHDVPRHQPSDNFPWFRRHTVLW